MGEQETVVDEIPEEGSAERTRLTASALHRRERQAFGGAIQWEAVFFGWLAAIGLAAMLVAMVVGAGVAVGLIEFSDRASVQVEELSFGGGVVLVAIVALAYAAGGYVAARMARFDGWRQGLGVWVLSLLMALAVAVAAWIAGGELNPLQSLELPKIPVDEGPLNSSEGIAIAIVALAALASAIAGGILGERFHRAVDKAGIEVGPPPPPADSPEQEPEPLPDAAEAEPESKPSQPRELELSAARPFDPEAPEDEHPDTGAERHRGEQDRGREQLPGGLGALGP